jgi:3D (Asp-Asp-Asp) domain-containing protein
LYNWKITALADRVLLIFALALGLSFIPALGQIVPEWFGVVHQYWKDGQITDLEFANAITYLQKIGIMRLEESGDGAIEDYLFTISLVAQSRMGHSEFSNCSYGWYITGYFTPSESDYSGEPVSVIVDGTSYQFREDFVNEIKIEGWGKTVSGNYLGWYDESFHLSYIPLDSMGNPLEVNTVAVDPSIIKAGSQITIPSLPDPWSGAVFVGSDTGPAIIGKHIDVYTGEGKEALEEAYRITGYNNTVCAEAE